MKKTVAATAALALATVGVLLTPTAAAADGTVSGTVRDGSNNPITNAVVEFDDGNGSTNYYYTAGDDTWSTQPTLGNGTYTVYIHAPGFASEFYDDSLTVAGATPVVITNGSSQVLSIVLSPESTISGTVTDFNDAPVAGARVFAVSENLGWSSEGIPWDVTDANGDYDIPELSAGNYKIVVRSTDNDTLLDEWYQNEYTEASADVIALGADADLDVDVKLAEGATVQGTVSNSIGSPIRAEVQLEGTIQPVELRQQTDNNGDYDFNGVLADSYTVELLDPEDFFDPLTVGPVQATYGTPVTANLTVTPRIADLSDFTVQRAPLTGPTSVQAGKQYTWTLDVDDSSDVYVILYSSPVVLGAAPTVGGNATVTLTIPSNITPGAHTFTYSTYDDSDDRIDDVTRLYFPITVTAALLPAAGVDGGGPAGVAVLLLLAGAGAVYLQRRWTTA